MNDNIDRIEMLVNELEAAGVIGQEFMELFRAMIEQFRNHDERLKALESKGPNKK